MRSGLDSSNRAGSAVPRECTEKERLHLIGLPDSRHRYPAAWGRGRAKTLKIRRGEDCPGGDILGETRIIDVMRQKKRAFKPSLPP